MIKLLVVDDDNLIRSAVSSLLTTQQNLNVLGSFESGEEALEFISKNAVDIIILDLNMPGLGGYETTRRIHVKYPKIKIIILTISKLEALPHQLFKAGASAYLTKGCATEELFLAIKRVQSNTSYIDRELVQQISINLISFDQSPFENLSQREMQIITMIMPGMKLIDIAEALNLSPKTVSTHRARAFEKLAINSDMELFKLAAYYNLI